MAGLILIVFVVVGIVLVLILTDLVKVTPEHRALASKVATVLFLAMITWVFVTIAQNS